MFVSHRLASKSSALSTASTLPSQSPQDGEAGGGISSPFSFKVGSTGSAGTSSSSSSPSSTGMSLASAFASAHILHSVSKTSGWKNTRGRRPTLAAVKKAHSGPLLGAPPVLHSPSLGGFVATRSPRSGVTTLFTTRLTTFETFANISFRFNSSSNARRGKEWGSSAKATPRKAIGFNGPVLNLGLVTNLQPSKYTPGTLALNVHWTFFDSPGFKLPSISVKNHVQDTGGLLECGNCFGPSPVPSRVHW